MSPVPAVADFGSLAAVGIVASFLLTFVPALRDDRESTRARPDARIPA